MVRHLDHCPHLRCAASRGCRKKHNEPPADYRLRGSLLAVLMVVTASLPVGAGAAGNSAAHASHTPNVIMMVGGMASGDDAVAASPAVTPTKFAAASDDDGRLSVVIQPGVPLSSASTTPNASVASRVMALAPMVDEAARAANMDSALLMAVIDVESGGNPQAVSPKGATGLMQLMPDTGARHGASNLFDPRQNIAAGARYLRQLMRQFGDLQLALAAYNAGEGAVQKYGRQIPPYAETMSYVPRVMGRYLHYRNAMTPTGVMPSGVTTDAAQGRFLLVRQSGGEGD
jgi:soluble lytic murein transglycosylase-like protein